MEAQALMAGRPKRKARLIAQGKSLPSWKGSRPSQRGASKVRLAHREVATTRHTTGVSNHEIIEGHPSQAPAASPGQGSPFCSSASVKVSDIAYHVGDRVARQHCKKLPPKFRPGQVVVTERDEDVGGGTLYSIVATWCDGGRIKTFIGVEGS